MKTKIILFTILIAISFSGFLSAAAEKAETPAQSFYLANADYAKQNYAKAVEGYLKVLDAGIESGNLYYNIGNGFFKLGKIGYAILCYERARRLIPADSDLKSNLNYARSLVEDGLSQIPRKRFLARMIERPFESFNLNSIVAIGTVLYTLIIIIVVLNMVSPAFARKSKVFLMTVGVVFFFNLAAFGIRYYEEEILKYGIVMQKGVECKYEPIDQSTTYYRLGEGNIVRVIKTRDDWRQIRSLDGKIAWVKKDQVEEI